MLRAMSLITVSALVLACAAGCALFSDGKKAAEPVQPAPAQPQSRPGADVFAKSAMYKTATDDGRDVLKDMFEPIQPVFKTRTFGELTQVSFTRVGGDNDVAVSPAEDLVAFSSDRHSADHNIYIKSVSGAVVVQKTSTPFDEIQPAFSPDGSRIAFASNKNGNYDVWIIDTHANGAAVQVTFGDEDDLHPSWMPDGETVVYSSYSSRTADWSIMASNVRSGEVKDLGPGKFPTVSPDGKRILFQRARLRDGYWYSIWTMNLEGADQTEILASADWAAINPCWSPDGQFIAFATVHKSPEAKLEDRIWRGDDIYVVSSNGRELIQITADTAPDWAPYWSQRDGRIYFISERNGFRNIWSIQPPVYSVVAAADASAQ